MLVRPGDTIATLDDISVIKLDFSIPETFLGSLGLGLEVRASSAAYRDKTFFGTITAIDTRVDSDTRAIKVRAEIPNQELLLKPGMLLTTVVINDRRRSMMVPEEAVVPVKDTLFVYVVRDGERGTTVEQRRIEIGARRPGAVEVIRGLEIGERVVTEGTHRISAGANVNVVNTVAADDSGEPAG
jgi:membrane fusion protein (multidrug efflux system)